MSAIIEIAGWVAADRHDPPEAARRNAGKAFFDTIACMIAGLGDPAVKATATAARAFGGAGATALPALDTAAPWAAMVNGTAAHVLDFDDGENVAFTHASAVLVPALLALGEDRGATGRDLIEAYCVGYEVLIRLGQWIGLDHYRIGWHSTSTTAALGAAAACAALMRVDADKTAAALSIVSSMIGGFRNQFGTMVKPFHAGLGAKNGLTAAVLAAAGMTGSPTALDGTFGWGALMTQQHPARPFAEGARLGDPWAIATLPPTIKRFASCGATHGTLDGVLELLEEERFGLADVASLETELPEVSLSALHRAPPRNAMEARFSMEHCVAAAIDRGGLTLADFSPEATAREDFLAFRERVSIVADTDENAYNNGAYTVRTRIALKDGRQLERDVALRKGTALNPLTDDDLLQKFRSCTAGAYGLRDEAEIMADLLDFAGIASIPEMVGRLRGALFRR